jgi:hypothetical protein
LNRKPSLLGPQSIFFTGVVMETKKLMDLNDDLDHAQKNVRIMGFPNEKVFP